MHDSNGEHRASENGVRASAGPHKPGWEAGYS